MFSRGMNRLCGAPQRLSVDGIYAGEFIRQAFGYKVISGFLSSLTENLVFQVQVGQWTLANQKLLLSEDPKKSQL